MNEPRSEVTLKEVALLAKKFANLLEDIGYQQPDIVTEELRELHAKAFKFWWARLLLWRQPWLREHAKSLGGISI